LLGTTFDTHPGTAGQSLCKMRNDVNTNAPLIIEELVPLDGPEEGRCEKNWLPVVKDGELYAIYSYQPTTVLKIDRMTGKCEVAIQKDSPHDFSKLRGSAAPIPFDNGFLALVHEVAFTDERTYLHRFVFFDKDFNITKASKPFTFLHKGIEYSCGMTTDHDEKQLIISIGLEDRKAFLAFVDLDYIRTLLETLPKADALKNEN
jgi:hypothetical protein